MNSTEILALKSDLLLVALKHANAKWDAQYDGRSEDAEYHDRQYRQAQLAYNDLNGGGD